MFTQIIQTTSLTIKLIAAEAYGTGAYGTNTYNGDNDLIDSIVGTGGEILILIAAVVAIGSSIVTYRKLVKKPLV